MRTAYLSGPGDARRVTVTALAAVALALTGCVVTTEGAADTPTVQPGELDEAGGNPCPEELPIGDDPSGHGFGVEHAAEELPELLEPQEAWVCRYDSEDRATTESGGVVMGWRRAAGPDAVAPETLPALGEALDGLALVPDDQACTADLGPRWMVVYSHDGDLTGVVVDDYGCRRVRLTDDPHHTPPGSDGQEGVVGGILDGGHAVLEALGPVQRG
ncbi:hypothetical protein FB476_0957 [Ornithinimicrobium humiphilum]|uniref:Uncharacterized protein n=1 Tax=Ornithinimicrobium humiphilum TaxID=125288 RepID=A0A543KLX9_9MICO|nr:hypothetical protein FB476_0957 [Ornithinimicrobium humiphilum]